MKLRTFPSVCAGLLCLLALAGPALAQTLEPPVHPKHTYDPPHPDRLAIPGAVPMNLPNVNPNFVAPNTTTWTPLGPAALNAGVPDTGRLTGVAVDPTNPNNIYVAAAGGGVWQSTDGGTTYNPLTDTQPSLIMGAIAIAPTNHLKIYAGTGEANNSGDSNYGMGILVSNDGGANWTLATGPNGIFNRVTVAKISVDPTNANIAYAAIGDYAENGIYGYVTGIYKTTDGGTTWANTTAAIDTLDPWSDIVVDPNTPTVLYATVGVYTGATSNGLYRSTNSGTSWSLISTAPTGKASGRFALAIAPSATIAGSHVLYVAVTSPSTYGLLSFLRSDNADSASPTFTTLSGVPNFGGGQGWYDWIIGVDPSNSANVYAAGVTPYNVIRSTNSGVTWTNITSVGGVTPHTDSHAMAFDSSNRLLLGNDGGIWRFDPAVPSWTNLNGNLNTIQLTGIGLQATMTGTVVGGSQDNGTELTTGSQIWLETDGGDGGYSQISQTNPQICYSNHPIGSYGSTSFFRVSTNGCNSFVSRTPTITTPGNFDFYSPIFVDPLNGNRVFLGGDALYESTTAGTAWTTHAVPASPIDTIAVLPGGQTIYIATGGEFVTNSAVYVSLDDGVTWTARPLPTGAGRVQEVDIDPNDATGNTAVVVINNFNSTKAQIYRTVNAGVTWTSINGNLAAIPAWSAKIDTDASATIYVSNEVGVYSSRSPYGSWSLVGSGLPHAQVVTIQLNSALRVISVATHGRGAWYLAIPSQQIAFTNANMTTFPIGAVGSFTITASGQPTPSISESGALPLGVSFVDNGNGTATLSGAPAAGTAGSYPITLTAQNGVSVSGTQSFTLTVSQQQATFGTMTFSPAASEPQGTSQSITISDTVGYTGVPPTGAVTFVLNGTSYTAACVALGSSETCSAVVPATTIAALAPSSYTVTVALASDATYASGSGPSGTFVIRGTTKLAWAPSSITGYQNVPIGAGVLDATANVPGTFAYTATSTATGTVTVTPTSVLAIGAYTLTATFTPSDTTVYSTATISIPFTVVHQSVFVANTGGSVTSLFEGGANQSNAVSGGGIGIAIDNAGVAWSITTNGTSLSLFNDAGQAATTYSTLSSSPAKQIAIDGNNVTWLALSDGTLTALTNTGAASTNTAIVPAGSSAAPGSLTVDAAGSLWISNPAGNSVTEVIGVAGPVATPTVKQVITNTPGSKP